MITWLICTTLDSKQGLITLVDKSSWQKCFPSPSNTHYFKQNTFLKGRGKDNWAHLYYLILSTHIHRHEQQKMALLSSKRKWNLNFASSEWKQVTHLVKKSSNIKLKIVTNPELYMQSFPKTGFSRIKGFKKIKNNESSLGETPQSQFLCLFSSNLSGVSQLVDSTDFINPGLPSTALSKGAPKWDFQ